MADTLQIWPMKDNPHWNDGDPFDLFRQCRILRANAEAIIRDQYGKHLALLEPYYAQTRLWRYEVISRTEFQRTNLITSEVETVGPTANAVGLHSHISEYLEGARLRGRTAIFGEPGLEVVYEGGVPIDDARAGAIWDAMEANTPHRRVDHLDLQPGTRDWKNYLFVEIEPVTREERVVILEVDREQTGVDPDTGDPVYRRVKQRKRKVDWEDLPGMDAAKITAIRDPAQSVDYRKVLPRVVKTVAILKSVEAIQ